MKELSIEQKAKRYDEALKKAKIWYVDAQIGFKKSLENLFPELKCDDEKIRKEIIECVKNYGPSAANPQLFKNMLAWLEKQGEKKPNSQMEKCINCQFVYTGYCDGTCILKNNEQKPDDNVEPKFKVGDWVVYDINGEKDIDKIVEFDNDKVSFESGEWSYIYELNKDSKLWTIQDAKDGDVLSNGTTIFIFKDLLSDDSVMSYCDYYTDGGESDVFCPLSMNLTCSKITPATKEQRDTLMKAMADAGYTFDFEKKEMNKIEQKSAEWSEEDDKILKSIIINIENLQFSEDMREKYHHIPNANKSYYQIMIDWLKSLKDRVQPQLKQEWKQENTDDLTDFENAMMHIGGSFFGQYAGLDPNDTNEIKKQANILLELVPKQEWNEEDDKKLIERLKSLRPQNRWKPSEEQMNALDDVISSRDIKYDVLSELWTDLNKLREE